MVEVSCVKENHDAEISFYLIFLPLSFFSISHSSIKYREICVKGFSGTTVPRILKFCINTGYDFLYYVRENLHPHAYHSLYLSFFLFLQKYFVTDFSAAKRARVFRFHIHLQAVKASCVKKKTTTTKKHNTEFCFCFILPFFHLSLQSNA